MKVLIIESGIGKAMANKLASLPTTTVLKDDTVNIDGVKYIPRKEESIKPKPTQTEEILNFGGIPYINHYDRIKAELSVHNETRTRELSRAIDIVKEMQLIAKKESKLSKWERDEVVRKFHKLYEPDFKNNITSNEKYI